MAEDDQDDPIQLRRELERCRGREEGVLRALGELADSTSLIAHELKNAASAVHVALRAAAGTLGVDADEALSDLVARLRNVERGVRRAVAFAAPLEAQSEDCEPIALFAEVLEARQAELEAAGTKVARLVDDDLRLRADRRHLVAALAELLDNAARAARGGRIRLRASREGARVILEVEDDGPGFSDDARTHLFEPFAARTADGTGTGLATCKRLVEANHGTVEAGDSELGGARVRLTLPAAPA